MNNPGYRLPRCVPLFVALAGAALWYYSRQPLAHTDLWGHLAYGRLISQTGHIPATEPFMPLARDVPLVDTAWLSQVAGYAVISRLGPAGIQLVHAALIATCFLLVARAIFLRTQQALPTFVGLAFFAALNWFQFQIVRPQMAGLVCYCALLMLLLARRWSRHAWWITPLLFCLWANLHGSFVVGLALVACAAVGRAIDLWRRTRRGTSIIGDASFRRLVLLTALAAVVATINPYGLSLYSEILSVSRNPNLRDLTEWQALKFGTRQGMLAGIAAGALLLAWLLSRRRIRAGEALAAVGLAAAVVGSARMLVWWAPIAAASFAIHAQSAWRRFFPSGRGMIRSRPAVRWTIVSAALGLVSLAATPLGLHLLFGREIRFEESVSAQTPLAATEWLNEHPSAGQLFNPYEWGDYLVWAGPPEVRVFVTSQAHLVPRAVWRDYMSVIRVAPGWEETLDRYQVERVLVDRRRRGALIDALGRDRRWKRIYADEIAILFAREGRRS